jgi:glucose/arabinose dehydrogenase
MRQVDASTGYREDPVDALRLFAVIGVGVIAAAVAALLLLPARSAQGAATLPAGFIETRVAVGLVAPTSMTLAPDGRIFVTEQGGRLRVIQGGALLAAPFATFSVDSRGERGLLGVALDPAFSRNGYVYVYLTTRSAPVHNRVVRLRASGNREAPGSRRLIFRLDNLSAAQNHNGGALHFGRDGRLYVAVGENARPESSQTLRNLFGKMLRINRDGSIPRDNPFFTNPQVVGRNRAIWARGLRNPFSFAVQPGTGRIFINDVGAQTWEEIDSGSKGANYGWPTFEGPEASRRFVPPLFAYRHGSTGTTGCAIAGGAFYNAPSVQFPAGFVGDYFFADLCGGWIRRYDLGTDRALQFASGIQNPVDLDVGNDGSLYYLERGTGSVWRIQHPG